MNIFGDHSNRIIFGFLGINGTVIFGCVCILNGFVLNAYSILTSGLYLCEIAETLPSCGLVLQFKIISTVNQK